MPSQCLANHRERSISAPLSKKTRRTDQSDSLGFKSDSLLEVNQTAGRMVHHQSTGDKHGRVHNLESICTGCSDGRGVRRDGAGTGGCQYRLHGATQRRCGAVWQERAVGHRDGGQ
ncbi:conserved hypothetical protein [Thiomonas sp. X19]|nr:conserved hypothetical protein [Thiomonas sp. X19]